MGITHSETKGRHGKAPHDADLSVMQAKFDAIVSNTASGIAVYEAVDGGEDFRIVDFNPAAEKIEHVERSNLIGRSVLEVFPGVREFGLLEVFQRVWRTGQSERHPVSVYRDNRIAGWRQNFVCKLPNGQIMAVYDDATEHKRSELAAKMSEQCFRAIADYTYDWEVWVGPTGRVLWTNPAVERVTGYSVKELIAMRDYPWPLLHEADRDRIMRAFQRAVSGGHGNDVCFRIRRKDAQVVWVEMSWQPIYDTVENPLGHRQSIRDVTARHKAEQAVQQAERVKETILDSLSEVVVQHDTNLKIAWANRAACESAGLPRDQLIGRYCYEFWGEGKRPCRDCPVVKAMEMGCRTEVEKTGPSGRTWSILVTPIWGDKGRIIGGVEIALDITRNKKTERALASLHRAYDQLEAETELEDPSFGSEQ